VCEDCKRSVVGYPGIEIGDVSSHRCFAATGSFPLNMTESGRVKEDSKEHIRVVRDDEDAVDLWLQPRSVEEDCLIGLTVKVAKFWQCLHLNLAKLEPELNWDEARCLFVNACWSGPIQNQPEGTVLREHVWGLTPLQAHAVNNVVAQLSE